MAHPTCGLMRVQTWNVAEKLLRFIQTLDYCPLLHIHALCPSSWSCLKQEVGLETSKGDLPDFVILWSFESPSPSVSVLIHFHICKEICKEIWFNLNLNKLFHCSLAQLGLNNFAFTTDKNTDKDNSLFSTDNHVKLPEVVLYLNLVCPQKFKMPDLMCIENIAKASIHLIGNWIRLHSG